MQAREDILKAIGEAVALRAAERNAVADAQVVEEQTTVDARRGDDIPGEPEPSAAADAMLEASANEAVAHPYVESADADLAAEESSTNLTEPRSEPVETLAAANDVLPESTDMMGAGPFPSATMANRSSRIASGLAWGIMGFLIGAVFWHFIGFWGFISEIVFVGGAVREERLVEQTGPQCVQLVLDRRAGAINSEPCPFDAPLLNEGALAVRSDFAGERGPKITSARPAIRLSDGTR